MSLQSPEPGASGNSRIGEGHGKTKGEVCPKPPGMNLADLYIARVAPPFFDLQPMAWNRGAIPEYNRKKSYRVSIIATVRPLTIIKKPGDNCSYQAPSFLFSRRFGQLSGHSTFFPDPFIIPFSISYQALGTLMV